MHIMEGFLPPLWCAVWYVIALPVVAYGLYKIKKVSDEFPESRALLAVSGAFMFVISSLKLPSVTGSCSHPTGNGLGVAIFGPAVTAVLATIVLVFQAILLAHGGITTLGANIVSMGIVGPLAGWIVYKALFKVGCPSKVNIFFVAFIADFATYLVTSVQLGLAFPEPTVAAAITKFFLIFAPTQLPLAIAEGLLTVIIWNGLMSYKPKLLNKLGVVADNELAKGD
ncbi:energy-coupling factor ABC transporter permease [uncultured Methanobrevibacter sp.]|uniref:energy-coupling factor ABC transporter permease n=1 Tax=uncultured Methanobrevibacter sp. TaxID=253161 RepID=UPI00262927AB